MSARFASHEEEKGVKKNRVSKGTGPDVSRSNLPLDGSRLGRFRGRNARRGDKTRDEKDPVRRVGSFFADGDERVRRGRGCGVTSGADEAAARRRAFARGARCRARAEGRPDASAARLGVPPRQIPRLRKHSLYSSFDIFRACASGARARRASGRGGAGRFERKRRVGRRRVRRDVPCRRAWTCGSWLCRCTRRSTPADLPRRPTEGAIYGTAWRGRAGTARRTPGARPAAS